MKRTWTPKPAYVQVVETWLQEYDTRHSMFYGGAVCERLDDIDALRAKVYLNNIGKYKAWLEDGQLCVAYITPED